MSAKVRNDGHFEREPCGAAAEPWKEDDWLKTLFNVGYARRWVASYIHPFRDENV